MSGLIHRWAIYPWDPLPHGSHASYAISLVTLLEKYNTILEWAQTQYVSGLKWNKSLLPSRVANWDVDVLDELV